MTSTSSNAVTSTTASTGATNTCTSPSLYDIPVNDTACAIPFGGNHTDVMSNCCKSADVVSYNDNCGLYCLVIDQTVSDVTQCLYGDGIGWADAFCRGDGNDTATATAGSGGALATGASVISNGDGASASKTGDSSSSSSTGSSSSNAAAGVAPMKGFGTTGLAVSGMLLSSVLFGVLQL